MSEFNKGWTLLEFKFSSDKPDFCILKLGQILTCPYFGGSNIGHIYWNSSSTQPEIQNPKAKIVVMCKAGGQILVQYPTQFRKSFGKNYL